MFVEKNWSITAGPDGVVVWVDVILPLSIATASIGSSFADVVEFDDPTINISAFARIENVIVAQNGTTFEISVD